MRLVARRILRLSSISGALTHRWIPRKKRRRSVFSNLSRSRPVRVRVQRSSRPSARKRMRSCRTSGPDAAARRVAIARGALGVPGVPPCILRDDTRRQRRLRGAQVGCFEADPIGTAGSAGAPSGGGIGRGVSAEARLVVYRSAAVAPCGSGFRGVSTARRRARSQKRHCIFAGSGRFVCRTGPRRSRPSFRQFGLIESRGTRIQQQCAFGLAPQRSIT